MTSGGRLRRIFCRLIPTVEVRGTGVDQGNGVVEMTAVVSRERARTTGLTATAGVLMLAVAFVMMVVAAPGHRTAPVHDPAKTATRQLTASRCDQLTSRSNSATVRACRAGPSADSAWADAYVPSMTSESWSASNPVLAARPSPASVAVS